MSNITSAVLLNLLLIAFISCNEEDSLFPKKNQEIDSLITLGQSYRLKDRDSSMLYYKSALAKSNELRYSLGIGKSFQAIGQLKRYTSEYDSAIYYQNRAAFIFSSINDLGNEAGSYAELGMSYQSINNLDSANFFLNKALSLYSEAEDTNGIAICNNSIGVILDDEGKYDSAILYYENAKKSFQVIGDSIRLTDTYANIGVSLRKLGDYDLASESIIDGIKIAERIGNLQAATIGYYNLGNVYYSIDEFDKAKINYSKANKLFSELKMTTAVAITFNSIAGIFKEQHKYDSAKIYFNKALQLGIELGQDKRISIALSNLGDLATQMGEFEVADSLLNEALKLKIKIGDLNSQAQTLVNIAFNDLKKNDFIKAIHTCNQALQLGDNTVDFQRDLFPVLIAAHSKNGNFKKAFEMQSQFEILRDSLFKEEKLNAISEAEAKYQNEKKQAEIIMLENESLQQQASIVKADNIRILLIGIVLVVLLVGGVIYYNNRKINQLNQQLGVANSSKETLFQILSHDLRTPLVSLQSQINALNGQKEIQPIKHTVNEAINLTDDLLKWSFGKKEQLVANAKPVEVDEMIKEVISQHQAVIDHKRLSIKQSSHLSEAFSTDESMMLTILRNTLGNALKFSPDQTEVTIDISLVNDQLRIAISNQKETRLKNSGAGVGMSLAHEIVEMIGGNIEINNESNTHQVVITIEKLKQ